MSLPTIFAYLPDEAASILKLAEKKEPEPSVIKTVGKGLLAFGGGTVAGFALGEAASQIYKSIHGRPIPRQYMAPAASVLGGGMTLAYALYKAKEQEELQRVLEAKRNRAKGRLPGK